MKNQWKKYMGMGMAAFVTFVMCSLFLIAVLNADSIVSALGSVAGMLESIIIGIVIAYLLNPAMNTIEKKLKSIIKNPNEKQEKWIKSISILIAMIFGVTIVVAVVGMMLPQLFESIYGIAMQMPDYVNNLTTWILDISSDYPAFEKYATQFVNESAGKINDFFTYDFVVMITKYLKYFTTGIISAFNTVMNVVVGIIVAVYVLYSKEVFAGQAKKILYAIFEPDKGNLILDTVRKTHQIFGGFIIGKIIDSAIIGVLCFICLSIMDMPFTLLVSVIVGVTNVIPFFGPFFGAIPSTIIILLESPLYAVYFVIFIFILQQVDGNIIGPAILGESTGLSSFWVIFAIMLFGGLFGVVGMIIGVPTVAIAFYLIKMFLTNRLDKKNYPVDTPSYVDLKEIDPQRNKLVYFVDEEEKRPPSQIKLFKKKTVKNDEKTEE